MKKPPQWTVTLGVAVVGVKVVWVILSESSGEKNRLNGRAKLW